MSVAAWSLTVETRTFVVPSMKTGLKFLNDLSWSWNWVHTEHWSDATCMHGGDRDWPCQTLARLISCLSCWETRSFFSPLVPGRSFTSLWKPHFRTFDTVCMQGTWATSYQLEIPTPGRIFVRELGWKFTFQSCSCSESRISKFNQLHKLQMTSGCSHCSRVRS